MWNWPKSTLSGWEQLSAKWVNKKGGPPVSKHLKQVIQNFIVILKSPNWTADHWETMLQMTRWSKYGFSPPCLRRATSQSPELWKHNWCLISRLWGRQYKHKQTDTHTNKMWKQKTSLCPSVPLQAFQALVFRHHRHRRKARPNGERRPAMTSPEKWDDFDIPWAHNKHSSD